MHGSLIISTSHRRGFVEQLNPIDGTHIRPAEVSAAWIWSSVSHLWTNLEPQGAVSPWFAPPGGRFFCLDPEAPYFREMPTGPMAFLGMPCASGLRLCARTHLKKGFVPHLSGCGTAEKYRWTLVSLVQSELYEPAGLELTRCYVSQTRVPIHSLNETWVV